MALIDTTGIRPIERRQPTDEIGRARRREEGTSSAFRPQTNVALKTAIQDLAATLSKISSEEKSGVQKMPNEIGDVIKNILRQSLSMDSTLNKGIGSTIESQRFSMDQLMLFSRLLSQMGTLAERNYSMKISDETKLIMTGLKDLIVAENGGKELEPVLMTKSAFELVDAKVADELPQALYEMLAQLSNMPAATQQQQPPSESMQFLKQLVRYFIPRPEVDDFAQKQESTSPQREQQFQPEQQTRSQSSAAQRFLDSMFRNFGGKFSSQNQQPQNQNQPQGQQQVPLNQNQPQGQQQIPLNQNPPQGQQQIPLNQNQPQGQQQIPLNQNQPQGQQQIPLNQNQPQGQQVPLNQNQPQGQQQTPLNQNQPQGQQQIPLNQNQPQGQQVPLNQNQPQGQQIPLNQNQPQGQQQIPLNQNQPQGQQQIPLNQNQPQGQQQIPLNQNQPQGQQVPLNQNQPQGQQQIPLNQNQPQGQQQIPLNQNQPQ
ncbi:MAG: hypothetical protein IKZ53_06250, partial [Selenomonadaceae bacterium]|nr:hypothetical protein [Selenomonadaceae bacterium]